MENHEFVDTPEDDWTLTDVVKKSKPLNWNNLFDDIDEYAFIEENIAQKNEENDIAPNLYFPEKKNIFRAFELTPLSEVKVVIIGQDPYHTTTRIDNKTVPTAQGLSFSLHKKDKNINPSLKNIFKELVLEGFTVSGNGDLTKWALQGVLLLNACLTVQPGKPKSHGNIWMGFIKRTIRLISEYCPGTVYILWGSEAKKFEDDIDNCHCIKGGHPSPLNRQGDFIGGDYFNKTNKILKYLGKKEIDWSL